MQAEAKLIIDNALKAKIEDTKNYIENANKEIDNLYAIQNNVWEIYDYKESAIINSALELEVKEKKKIIENLEKEIEQIYKVIDKNLEMI